MSRFDCRDVDTFKKDIYFGTQLEKYFFNTWLRVCQPLDYISISNVRNNGVDNDGGFVAKGKTSGADYKIHLCYHSLDIPDMPLEIKWVPTHGKLTLKVGDLKSYVREGAGILFIYTTRPIEGLKKPKDYNLTKHIAKIESVSKDIRWSLMSPEQVRYFMEFAEEYNMVQNVPYMGYKPGIILNQDRFHDWFVAEKWA